MIDTVSKKQVDLNTNINALDWSVDSSKIYYVFYSPDEKCTLNIADSDGGNWQSIADLDIANCNYYLQSTKDDIYFTNFDKIYDISLSGNIKTELIGSKLAQNFLMSLDKKNIVFNEEGGTITKIYNIESKSTTDLDRRIDLESAVLTSDGNIFYFKDTVSLVKFNITTSKEVAITLDDSALDKTNLIDDKLSDLTLSSDENILYFTYNNYIYKINLK